MTTQEIFEKYWDALVTTNIRLGGFDESVVRTVLHLAIRDTDREAAARADDRDSWRALAEGLKTDAADLHQRLATALQERDSLTLRVVGLEATVAEQPNYEDQQNRLMRWLIDNEPVASLALDANQGVAGAIIAILDKQNQEIANYATINAELKAQLRTQAGAIDEAARLRQEIADLREQVIPDYQANLVQLQEDVDRLTRQNTIAVDTFNALAAERTNGANGANPTTAAQSSATDWGRNHPAWQGMDDESHKWVCDLASGTKSFRQAPVEIRLELVRRVIGSIGSPSMARFDAQKPVWLPSASSLIKTSGQRWTELQAQAQPAP